MRLEVRRAVAEIDYQAVAAVLESEGKPGDVVLLHPWWTERARIYVPERVPVVGYQGSESDPLELHPRIWVLSQPRMDRRHKLRARTQAGHRRRQPHLLRRRAAARVARFLTPRRSRRKRCEFHAVVEIRERDFTTE